jgi:hypothetical protein
MKKIKLVVRGRSDQASRENVIAWRVISGGGNQAVQTSKNDAASQFLTNLGIAND